MRTSHFCRRPSFNQPKWPCAVCLALALLVGPRSQGQQIVYDNFSTPNAVGVIGGSESGDEVGLAGESRQITQVVLPTVQFGDNSQTLTLRLYDGGPTPLKDIVGPQLGPAMTLGPLVFPRLSIAVFAVPNVDVPGDNLIWTIEFDPPSNSVQGPVLSSPPIIGTSEDFYWRRDGGPYNGFTSLFYGGNPVANFVARITAVDPELTLSDTQLDFGNVRVGTSLTNGLAANNADGDPGSLLRGVALSSPLTGTDFSGGAAGPLDVFEGANGLMANYTYTPSARTLGVADIDSVIATTSNDSNASVFLTGQGVGPVFAFAYHDDTGAYDDSPLRNGSDNGGQIVDTGATIDFGAVTANSVADIGLTIRNDTTDGDLGGLTDLHLLDVLLSGPDGADFLVLKDGLGFEPGLNGPEVIAAGEQLDLVVAFSGSGSLGPHEATLLIQTDQGAAAFGDGADFRFELLAVEVPEPGSFAIWLVGGLGMLGAGGFGARTAERHWTYARVWLHRELEESQT